MKFGFAKSSEKRLKEEAAEDLRVICYTVKERSEIDFDISCCYRSLKDQNREYLKGTTTIDGINNRGKHNVKPSEAVDIYCYTDKGGRASYTVHQMAYMAGVFRAVSEELYESGITTHKIRWGGNWDQDGVIITDQQFDDLPHFEIYKP